MKLGEHGMTHARAERGPTSDAAPEEPPYRGPAARTRREPTLVAFSDGVLRPVEVYVAVDVASDPALRDAAFSGALHRLEGGEELAIPYVFHDPDTRRLAIVVPPSLRHRALAEKAAFLARVAQDAAHEVPRYVQDAPVVIGHAGLQAWLSEPVRGAAGSRVEGAVAARTAELAQREATVAAREAELAAREAEVVRRETDLARLQEQLQRREERLAERGEALTRREDEIRVQLEELEAGQRDLALREQELEARVDVLRERERELAAREAAFLSAGTPGEGRGSAMSGASAVAWGGGPASPSAGPSRGVSNASPAAAEVASSAPVSSSLPSASVAPPPPDGSPRGVQSPGSVPPPVGLAAARDTEMSSPGAMMAGAVSESDVEEEADAEDVEEEVDDLVAEATGRTSAAVTGVRPTEPLRSDEVEELVDEEEVAEEIDELEPLEATGVGPSPQTPSAPATDEHRLDEQKTHIGVPSGFGGVVPAGGPSTPSAIPPVQDGRPPTTGSVPPPPGFFGDPDREVAVSAEEGVRLFVRLDSGKEDAFAKGADLLVQLANVQGYPVAVLAMVAQGDDPRPYVRRAALDPRAPGDRLVLDALRRHFAVRASLYASDGRHVRTLELTARREGNVALLLERAIKAPDAKVDGPTACERALTAPPPVREAGHPFVIAEDAPPAPDARTAAANVVRLTAWATPEKYDRALLVLCIPRPSVEAAFRRCLEDAIDYGLALPAALRDRAVALGLANDVAELVSRQIESFRRVAVSDSAGGLSPEEVATNWDALLAAASEFEVAIDAETHDLAHRAIARARGGSSGSEVDLTKIGEMGPPELVLLLEHPRARRHAALELCRRGDPEFADVIFKAVRKMPRAEVVRVVPKLVALGESMGDALIDGLSARKTFVRQASALALGQLKLRRAVMPLMHALAGEPSGVWREIARVIGEFGAASYRALLREVTGGKVPEDRLAYALAHAANHGQRKALQQVATDPSNAEQLVAVAQRAIVLEDEAKQDALEVRGERPIAGADPVKSFSRRFYEELAGTAPEGDLDE
jgi:hypothetical protein